MIEIPTGSERDYFRAFGVVSLFIAASPARMPCLTGYTRDLGCSLESIRTRWHWSVEITHAWWVAEAVAARKLIDQLSAHFPTDTSGRFDATDEAVAQRVVREAAAMGVILTAHAEALQRVRAAVTHVDKMIEDASLAGKLQWFNAAYRQWRTTASHNMALAMPYALARTRLRAAVVRRMAEGEPKPMDPGAICAEIFRVSGPQRGSPGALAALGPDPRSPKPKNATHGLPSANGRLWPPDPQDTLAEHLDTSE